MSSIINHALGISCAIAAWVVSLRFASDWQDFWKDMTAEFCCDLQDDSTPQWNMMCSWAAA